MHNPLTSLPHSNILPHYSSHPLPSLAGSWRAVQCTATAPRSAALATPWTQSHACGRCSHLLFEQASYVPLACCCTHVCTRESARRDGDACERAEVHSYIVARSSPAAAKVLSLPAKSATAQPSSTLLHNPLTSLPHSNILPHYSSHPLPSLAGSWRAVQCTATAPRSAALATPWTQSHACGRCSHLLFEQASYVPLACCCTHVCTRESARRDGDACERAEVHSYIVARSSLVQCSCVF